MFTKIPNKKCRVMKEITDHGIVRCLKPASVVLALNLPEDNMVMLCPDCARELAKEIIDSVPDGCWGVSRRRK